MSRNLRYDLSDRRTNDVFFHYGYYYNNQRIITTTRQLDGINIGLLQTILYYLRFLKLYLKNSNQVPKLIIYSPKLNSSSVSIFISYLCLSSYLENRHIYFSILKIIAVNHYYVGLEAYGVCLIIR